jgi:hypothetical protein
MKQLFRNPYYLAVLLSAMLFVSCKKNEVEKLKPEPKMLTFGFYAADNPGIILQDYVIDPVSGNAVNIEMPKAVNKSKLKARFTTTENTTVTVSGAPQQSGTSEHDFTVPVDYIVTEGVVNARYTVTIVNAADYVWSRAGAFTSANTNTMMMRVNPKSGSPYIFYRLEADVAENKKAAISQFVNGSWSAVGPQQGFSGGEIGTIMDLQFNPSGIPYVLYSDYSATVSRGATVQQFAN